MIVKLVNSNEADIYINTRHVAAVNNMVPSEKYVIIHFVGGAMIDVIGDIQEIKNKIWGE